jgi:hypothetical protein
MKKERCLHRGSWLLGGVWEWCYRCGALRRLRVTGPAACAPDSRWLRPGGAKGVNPFKLADLPKRAEPPSEAAAVGSGIKRRPSEHWDFVEAVARRQRGA